LNEGGKDIKVVKMKKAVIEVRGYNNILFL